MPTATYALAHENVIIARCFGHIEPADIINWNIDARVQPMGTQPFLVVVDLSGVTGTDMTFNDINAIHGKLSRHYASQGRCLHLILYAPEDLAFGMTRILESLSAMTDAVQVEVYRSLDAMDEKLPHLTMTFTALKQNLYDETTGNVA